MANSKISALPAASTPLAGTELVPVVQGGITEQVSVANLTAGRAVSVLSLTSTNDVTANGATFGKGASGLSANTAGGNGALASATSGNFNTAFGYRALNKITTGAGNVAVGQGALENNDNAYSVAIGQGSLNTTTNGYRNTAAGKDSLLGLTSGYDMTAVGYSAGSTATTGNNNAFWGNNAQPSAVGVNNEYTYGNSSVTTHRFYGNLTPITAAKGINFTANTPAAGMTSQLLNWYEEGTFSPTLAPTTSGTITASGAARYTRVGRLVTVEGYINVSAVSSPVGELRLGGFPFTLSASSNGAGSIQPYGFGNTSLNTALYMLGVGGTAYAYIRGYLNGAQIQTIANNAQNGAGMQFTFTYSV
jgi:hypothetical protein